MCVVGVGILGDWNGCVCVSTSWFAVASQCVQGEAAPAGLVAGAGGGSPRSLPIPR
jgi:hypothetical protein